MMIPLYKILLNLKAHPIVVAIHTCTHAHTHAYTIDVAYCSFPDVCKLSLQACGPHDSGVLLPI